MNMNEKEMVAKAAAAWHGDSPTCYECPQRMVQIDGSGAPEYTCRVLDGEIHTIMCAALNDGDDDG